MRGVSCRTRSSAGGPLWSSCFRLAQRQQIQISSDTYPRVITKHVDAGIGFQSVGQLYTPLLTGTEANPWLCASSSANWRSWCWSCRSEEHTSELQSLMRISYAVFCLKKKKNKNNQYH